ncbi:MAG: ABC transporter permease [Candidatus Methylomirabilales bacterium]
MSQSRDAAFAGPGGEPSPPAQVPAVRIRPSRGWVPLRLHDLWEYRELLYFLAWRTIRVRYKQTLLGAGWAIAQPLFTMGVFTLVFARFAGVPSDGVPYPLFAFCGLLPWQLFAQSLGDSSNSLVNSGQLIAKVYFPRLVIPCSTALIALLDFAVAGTVLAAMMAFYRVVPTGRLLLLPLLIALALALAIGAGLWLSALNVRYKDVRHLLPLLTQIWLLATPVAYPGSLVPERWRFLLSLNPLAGVVEGFRWALLGTPTAVGSLLPPSCVMAAVLLLSGAAYFRRMERTFADML